MNHHVTVDHLTLKTRLNPDNPVPDSLLLSTLKDFKPFADGDEDLVKQITGVPFAKMKRRTRSQTNSFRPVFTLSGLVDAEFKKHGSDYLLDKIVVHGSGWGVVPYSVEKMISAAAHHDLHPYEVHYKFDVPSSLVTWETIERHLNPVNKAFTCNATVNSFTSADRADGTKISGYRAGGSNANGYCVSFYPSAEVHPELPPGTWRIEVQARGATALGLMLESDKSPAVLALVRDRINFRSLTENNKNKSERSVPRWWTTLLKGAGSFRSTSDNPSPTIERRKERLKSDLYSRIVSIGEPVFIDALNDFILKHLEGYELTKK